MYSAARNLLFKFEPETAHNLSLNSLKQAERFGLSRLLTGPVPDQPVTVMGINFPNPVGLAAGLDKNGDYIDALAALGFGFIEIGTVTPRPQPGNPEPRLFRLPEHQAIINRMGFNNKGVDYLLAQVQRSRFNGVLGINIGKNFDTPVENALDDYRIGLRKVYKYAHYITVNISSPNTPGLRDLQFGEQLSALLKGIKWEQAELAERYGRYVPVAIKIAPDMVGDDIERVAETLVAQHIDAVIATNTTLARDAVSGHPLAEEAGGLSGAPLTDSSTAVISALADRLQGELPIIGVGGIMSGEDAAAKVWAGAELVQLYTGFIYRGPNLIRDAVTRIGNIRKSAA